MFEMTCGYELTTTTPTSDDYKVIRKRSKESQVSSYIRLNDNVF